MDRTEEASVDGVVQRGCLMNAAEPSKAQEWECPSKDAFEGQGGVWLNKSLFKTLYKETDSQFPLFPSSLDDCRPAQVKG